MLKVLLAKKDFDILIVKMANEIETENLPEVISSLSDRIIAIRDSL